MDWWVILLIVVGVIAVLLAIGAIYALKRAFWSVKKNKIDYYRGLDSGRCYDPERCRVLIDKMTSLDREALRAG